MSVTPANIREFHPEYSDLSDTFIQKFLTTAESMLDETAWRDSYDTGVEYLCCHLIAVNPHGISARLITDSGNSIYKETLDTLKRQVGSAYRMISGG